MRKLIKAGAQASKGQGGGSGGMHLGVVFMGFKLSRVTFPGFLSHSDRILARF